MVGKPRAGRGDALSRERCGDLVDGGVHGLLDPGTRCDDVEADDVRSAEAADVGSFDH